MLDRLRIGPRIGGGFAVQVVLVALIGFVGWRSAELTTSGMDQLTVLNQQRDAIGAAVSATAGAIGLPRDFPLSACRIAATLRAAPLEGDCGGYPSAPTSVRMNMLWQSIRLLPTPDASIARSIS